MRIILFLCLILFLIILFRVSSEILDKRAKFSIAFLLVIFGGGIFVYSKFDERLNLSKSKLVAEFYDKGYIKCENLNIDTNNYEYKISISSFVPKQRDLGFDIVDISRCLKSQNLQED
ncbi:MAG: hypothetical protein ACTTIV_04845 [Campylobacter sp.]